MKINYCLYECLFQKGGVNISKKIHFTLILALMLFISISAISANEINTNDINGVDSSDAIGMDSVDNANILSSDLTDDAVNADNSNDVPKEGSVSPAEDSSKADQTVNPPISNDEKGDATNVVANNTNNTNNSTQPSKEKTSVSVANKSVVRGSNLKIYLKDSSGKGISGKTVKVQIGGKTYTKTTNKNGLVAFNFTSFLGKYSLKVIFNGDSSYLASQNTYTINFYRLTPKITVSSTSVARGKSLTGYLKKSNGNAFAGKKLTITYRGKKYYRTTNSKGKFSFKISAPAGNYKIKITYPGSTSYKTLTKAYTVKVYKQKTNISIASASVVRGKLLYAYLKTNKGEALVNKPVTIKFTTRYFYKTTDKNGRVTLKINSKPGTYSTKVIYKGNGYYKPISKSFKLKSYVAKTKITVASSSVAKGKYFYAYLKDNNNKAVSGEKIVISINGAKYSRITNSNGRVALKINSKPKTYPVTVKHAASTGYKASSKSINLRVTQSANSNTAGTGKKITQKTIVIDTDVIYDSSKDTKFMNDIATALKAKGYKVIISQRGPNAHCNDIKGNYSNACVLCIFGGADSGMFLDMSSNWYQNLLKKYNNRVVLGMTRTQVDLATCTWLPRAHDDNYSPKNFTGLAYPGTYLNEHNMDYIYGRNASEMANNFLNYAVKGLSIGLNNTLPCGSTVASSLTEESDAGSTSASQSSVASTTSSKAVLGSAAVPEKTNVNIGSESIENSNLNDLSDMGDDDNQLPIDVMDLIVTDSSVYADTVSSEVEAVES